jgi:hypothetical protein
MAEGCDSGGVTERARSSGDGARVGVHADEASEEVA